MKSIVHKPTMILHKAVLLVAAAVSLQIFGCCSLTTQQEMFTYSGRFQKLKNCRSIKSLERLDSYTQEWREAKVLRLCTDPRYAVLLENPVLKEDYYRHIRDYYRHNPPQSIKISGFKKSEADLDGCYNKVTTREMEPAWLGQINIPNPCRICSGTSKKSYDAAMKRRCRTYTAPKFCATCGKRRPTKRVLYAKNGIHLVETKWHREVTWSIVDKSNKHRYTCVVKPGASILEAKFWGAGPTPHQPPTIVHDPVDMRYNALGRRLMGRLVKTRERFYC